MNIVFYGKRNTGMLVLNYLLAKGHKIKVIPGDDLIRKMCDYHGLEIVDLDSMGKFDLFICCHGNKIIPAKYLIDKKFINIHPCLKYKGHDPISRYIEKADTEASVDSLYMIESVDDGDVIESIKFQTPVVNSYAEFYNIAYPYYIDCIHKTLEKYEK